MGMCLGMVTLADDNIARLLSDPPLIWLVIAPDDPEAYEEARKTPVKPPSFLSRLLGAKQVAAGPVTCLVLAEDELVSTHLDKAWHGIHYLLTGSAQEGSAPLNFLVSGGAYVGNIEVGYGPARALTSKEVQEAHEALSRISDEVLRGRFAPADMLRQEIYPEIWDRDPKKEDPLGYLMEHVEILRAFLKEAVDEKRGMVVYLA